MVAQIDVWQVAAWVVLVLLGLFNGIFAIAPSGFAADALSITTSSFRTRDGRIGAVVLWAIFESLLAVIAGAIASYLSIDVLHFRLSVMVFWVGWVVASFVLVVIPTLLIWLDRLIFPESYRKSDKRWREEE